MTGLVPSKASGGARRAQGGITETGNSHGHARRLLVEAAWFSGHGNRRWTRLDARGKRSTASAVAIARELAGWTWSLAVMPDS